VEYVQVGLGHRAQTFRRVLGEMGDWRCVGLVLRRTRQAAVPVYTELGACLREVRADCVVSFAPVGRSVGVVETAVGFGVRVVVMAPVAATVGDCDRLGEVGRTGGTGGTDGTELAGTSGTGFAGADVGGTGGAGLAGTGAGGTGVPGTELVAVAAPYLYLPGHLARLAVVERGLIGTVSEVQIAGTPAHQAAALLREFLGTGRRPAAVQAYHFGADGTTGVTVAAVDFGEGRSGLVEYPGKWGGVRPRLLVRGDAGEISGDQVVGLAGHGLITTTYLTHLTATGGGRPADPGRGGWRRTDAITLGDQVVWTNPWPDSPWTDEELGVAENLTRLAAWVRGAAPAPYPLADALHDTRLGLTIDQARPTGRTVAAG